MKKLLLLSIVVILVFAMIGCGGSLLNEITYKQCGAITYNVDGTWREDPITSDTAEVQNYLLTNDANQFGLSVGWIETSELNTETFLRTALDNQLIQLSGLDTPPKTIFSDLITINNITGYRYKVSVAANDFFPEGIYIDCFRTIIDGKDTSVTFLVLLTELNEYEKVIEEVMNSIETISGNPNPLVEA